MVTRKCHFVEESDLQMDLLSVVRRLIESKNSEHENSLEMKIPSLRAFLR